MSSVVLHKPSVSQATLTVVEGRASKRTVALKLPAMLGRGEGVTVIIAHPTVSRRHCEVFERRGMLAVRDLDSLNGTYVGGQPVSEAVLMPGDLLTIGPLTFRVDYQPPAEQAASNGQPRTGAASLAKGPAATDPATKVPLAKAGLDVQDVHLDNPPPGDDSEHVSDMIDFVLGLNDEDDDSGIHVKGRPPGN